MIHCPRSVAFTLCMEGLRITTATILVWDILKTAFQFIPLPSWTILGLASGVEDV